MYTSRDPGAHHEVYFALVREMLECGRKHLAVHREYQ